MVNSVFDEVINPLLTVEVKRTDNQLPITDFKFIVNENNVGNPLDPNEANWPSMRASESHSPVVISGDSNAPTVSVPPGNYLVSVLAPGFKLGGNYVTVNANTTVTVELQPHPLPLSKIRIHVFHDNSPVNGEDDFPLEEGLPGFRVVIHDAVGEVTTDYFGNVLGTQYEKDAQGNVIIGPDGKPIPIANTGGVIWTDVNGDALIEYLAPGKYGVQAIPPDGTDWVQTTTLEGTPVIDAWIEEGNDGYLKEEGFTFPLVWIGFVAPMEFPIPAPGEMTGTITTQIRTNQEFNPPQNPFALGDPVDRPWVALTDIGNTDKQVFLGRGDKDGNIKIQNVPAGVYQMAIWDEPLDYIISFRTVHVPDPTSGLWDVTVSDNPIEFPGQIGIPRWFGWNIGKVYREAPGQNVPPGSTEGIPNVEINVRYRDGSIQYSALTNMEGLYSFEEVVERPLFSVTEVGFTRLGQSKATAIPDYDSPSQKPPAIYEGDLTLATLTWANQKNRINWGKKEYPLPSPNDTQNAAFTNGGISGIVYYATMRNELDPRYALAEGYEPGIPNVVVNLFATMIDPVTGEVLRGAKLNSVKTDAWEHPRNLSGNPVVPVPSLGSYIAQGVFDGGYAFTEKWVLDPNGNPLPDPNNPGEYLFEPLSEGTYIVEVEVPPGYKILDGSSVNTSEGDSFIPNVQAEPMLNYLAQESFETRDETTGSHQIGELPPPYEGNLRTAKIVYLAWGQNAAADFFLYTEVPVPGRIFGLVTDDLNIETDPNKIYYGEKRGVPHTPIGIRDYTGRLITTVYTDPNGIFEVLLPSTYTANIPSPSGIAPGMYRIIGNDPGEPDAPNDNFNLDYQTTQLVFDVWPGTTTYADVALFPITSFVSPFTQRPDCRLSDAPQITQVDRVYFPQGASKILVIKGSNFGRRRGDVTLDGEFLTIQSWTDTTIRCRIPQSRSGGAWQLLVHRADGQVSPSGITLHVFGTEYNPPVINVAAGESIQDAIDSAPNQSLIIVAPGTYYESPIVYKNVKLQGYGPELTKIDGRFFMSYEQNWLAKLDTLEFDGPRQISRGQALTVVAKAGSFTQAFHSQIDGFTIATARGTNAGGIYVNAYGQYLEISNCLIENNAGGFGGAITLGSPYVGDNHNDHIRIHHNRILNNGGVSLAGAIGIFNGADHYEIDHNLICGNYSAEYGGGISHYGLSRFGKIHHNQVTFNASFDEGAGIFIGGEQPTPPAQLSAGSGEVEIYNNHIESNVANDDGGGIRLLQPGTYRIDIYNNMIVNNVSTDLGGGIALDDASQVIIYNNTVAKNVTTATAEDSDGRPHAAGLASEKNSRPFQESLPPGSSVFSDPVLFNNIFWDNRAYYFDLSTGKLSNDYQQIDFEVFGTPLGQFMTPNYSYLTVPYGSGVGNIIYNGKNPPRFIREYNTLVEVTASIPQPNFKTVRIVVTPQSQGDYHIQNNSPVINNGVMKISVKGTVWNAPDFDYDDYPRPWMKYEIGAQEYWPFKIPLLQREHYEKIAKTWRKQLERQMERGV